MLIYHYRFLYHAEWNISTLLINIIYSIQLLKKRILQDGKCYEGGILKVDGFINHQMDPVLMKSIGVEFVRRFAATNVNKIMKLKPAVSPRLL